MGCLESNSISSRSLLKLTTEDCVRVVIEADGQEYRGYGTVYRLSDLLDLQSKLMLISARDDRSEPDSLNVFVNVRMLVLFVVFVFLLNYCLIRFLIMPLRWPTFILK